MEEIPEGPKPSFTEEEFAAVKERVEREYMSIGEVQCPALERKEAFNTKGLDHLKLKRWNHARNRNDQYGRLRLLHLVPDILKKSHTIQGIDEGNRMERIKVRGKWQISMRHVAYYEFIAVVKGCRIRVIVKQVDSEQAYFWSIIPFWKQGEYRRKMFEGDPETD